MRRKHDTRIGVDIGGTFTDLVLVQDGKVAAIAKTLTTPADPGEAVVTGVQMLLQDATPGSVVEVVHGTTLVANALIERRGAETALITTRGFRDTLAIRREHRYDLYDIFLELPEPLVPRRRRWELDERILADGSVDTPLDEGELRRLARKAKRLGVDAIAVSLLHSYRNPVHEEAIANLFAEEAPAIAISLSSQVVSELGEYVRTSTTAANAYVQPIVDRYLDMLTARLSQLGVDAPLHVMLSTGGLADVETGRRFPVRLAESGPAAGAMSAAFSAAMAGFRDVLAFDMGGTTAKACLVEDAAPLIAREHEVARVYRFAKESGLPIRVPVVDLIEIGAGGGSIARIDEMGLPKVGPESAAAEPGPVCYGRGGSEPTVTDADLVLGYLDPGFFLGGSMKLDVAAARAAIEPFAKRLGTSVEQAAAGIHRVVNENMAAAARMHAIERGRDLRRFPLVATGGAGPVHAFGVARALAIPVVLCPPGAGVASAFGMLAAQPTFDFARSLPGLLVETDWAAVRRVIEALRRDGQRRLQAAGVASDAVTYEVQADVRHRGQGDSLTVNLGPELGPSPVEQVEERFERAYVELFGRRPPGVDTEVLTWRLRAIGPRPQLRQGAASEAGTSHKGQRRIWDAVSGGFVDAGVYDRYRLLEGEAIQGPAVVEERESTLVIGVGGRASVDAAGNIVVEVGS